MLFLLVGAASAESPSNECKRRYHLDYRAPPVCPAVLEFLAIIDSHRFGDWWHAAEDEFAGAISVTVRGESDSYSAYLVLGEADERSPERRHVAASCEQVLQAVAFSIREAIQIRCGAHRKPPAAATAPKATPACPALSGPGRSRTSWPQVGGYAEVAGQSGADWRIGPEVSWGGDLLGGYRWPRAGWSARMGVGYWDTGWTRGGVGRVRLALARVVGEVCPFERPLIGGLSMLGCINADVGQHTMVGKAGSFSVSWRQLWASVGLNFPKLRYSLGHLFVEVGAGPSYSFVRRSLYPPAAGSAAESVPTNNAAASSDPAASSASPAIYEAPRPAMQFALALGWRFCDRCTGEGR